uniref:hypothetical protein n=1 Tax=Bacillus cereus TaxID=1396 RepID=UPI0035CF7FC3
MLNVIIDSQYQKIHDTMLQKNLETAIPVAMPEPTGIITGERWSRFRLNISTTISAC